MNTQSENDNGDVAVQYHLEISQSVQDMENSIPLIRGKRAYARAYFDHDQVEGLAKGVYRAHLHLTSPEATFISLTSLSLDSEIPVSSDRQRLNWDLSFNFNFEFYPDWENVPDEIATGTLELIPDSDGGPIELEADDDSKNFSVEASPDLKVTCLLLRYWSAEAGDYVMPDPVQVDTIRDFVVSAFPVAEKNLEWNTITVQATNDFQALSKLTKAGPEAEETASLAIRDLLLQTTVHRNMDAYKNPNTDTRKDWENNHDIRTIYLAVFDDPSEQLGGAAADSPTFPVHNVAGAAVVDLNGQIGAHELAHILGRQHPGVPRRIKYGPYLGQRMEDEEPKNKSEANGKEYMGFLNVESATAQGLHISQKLKAPRIYEPNLYFDLMTYREPQWLSDYSYLGIKERLGKLYEEAKKAVYTTDGETWVVIGDYDLNRQIGRILFVLPTLYKGLDLQLREYEEIEESNKPTLPDQLDAYDKIKDQLEIKLLCSLEGLEEDVEHIVYHRLPDNRNETGDKRLDMPNFGIFQATIETGQLEKIKLQVAGNIVDVFEGDIPGRASKYLNLLDALVVSLQEDTEGEQQEVIRIEDPDRYMKTHEKRSLFYYDVIEDEYYLRFNWLAKFEGDESYEERRNKLLDSKIISAIQCKRPKIEQSDADEWVTVVVNNQRKGNVWISPDLVNREEYSTDSDFRGKVFYSLLSKKARSLKSISKDSIEFRILFSAGFDKAIIPPVTTTAKIRFPNEFLQNQQDRSANQNYLDGIDQSLKDPPLQGLKNRSGKYRFMY